MSEVSKKIDNPVGGGDGPRTEAKGTKPNMDPNTYRAEMRSNVDRFQ